MDRTPHRPPILVAVLLMLIASSCGENDATESASDAGGGSGSRWVELLARIPATDTTSDFIVLDDFAAAAAYAETPAPDCATDVSSAYVFWNTLEFGPVVEDERGIRSRDREMEATPRLAFGSNLTDNHAWLEAWGFCPLQVAQAAVAGFGADEIRVYSGSFDLAGADAAIRATSTEVEGFTAEGDDAMLIYTWASDAAEPIDAGGRAELRNGQLVRTRSAAFAPTSPGAAAPDAASLADDEHVRTLVDALDAEGVYNIFIFRHLWGPTDPVVGTATGVDGGNPFVTLAVVHPDAESAARAAEAVEIEHAAGTSEKHRQPWTDLLSTRRIEAEGNVLLASFFVEQPGLLHTVFDQSALTFAASPQP